MCYNYVKMCGRSFILSSITYTFSENNGYNLNIVEIGMEKCSPGHFFGPAIRNSYLIHLIKSGEGYFEYKGKKINLKEKTAFLIYPNALTFYKASKTNPWEYYWINFNGEDSEDFISNLGLSRESPICNLNSSFTNIIETFDTALTPNNKSFLEMKAYGNLILHDLSKNFNTNNHNSNSTNYYINKAVNFIENNYYKPITVLSVAEHCVLNRSYFTSIFKKEIGISPKEFITQFKMEKAKVLLLNHNLSIGDVSRSVGFYDQLAFSKAFKAYTNICPKDYRNGCVY